ncbi:prepilin-type N-terminal cleavage/methylation domain-containing protein [Vibrio sp. TH_r3]|uniref:type IV pilus modification PilV family protein n=1 Tax=Vibrio sp. TH_r3 TaxID=3082084 RepID=UPI0029537EB3|nr:prepilin-type N-terminal cleavage/methylation domain-containing protein [Vibrio sp. TH_r3]MDV7104987.1 prepilin-type N-terminal cleavage/methylation domain-containing protein [Vibrio sp. TH_r3]
MNLTIRGFSLLEVLISILLISFSIIGLTTLQISTVKHSTVTQNQLLALYLAESQLERVRLESDWLVDVLESQYKANRSSFSIKLMTSEHPASSNLKQVEIQVSWQEYSGKQRTVSLESNVYVPLDTE